MSKLLYIKASPNEERSKSVAVADAFVEAYRQAHPDDEIASFNLFEREWPALDGLALSAKYTILHGLEHSAEESEAWKAVEAVIDEFKSADKYVLAVPMWNFGVPYQLKHYIDLLVQPGYTFSFSPEEGYAGLVTGRRALVVYARGGAYSDPQFAAMDHQKPYVEQILGFIGFTDVQSIVIEPTLMGGPDVAQEKVDDDKVRAVELAKVF